MPHSNSSQWRTRQQQAYAGGGSARVDRQHAGGKQTARERITLLLDADSFQETDQLAISPFLSEKTYTDGVVTGFGTIDGAQIALYAQDFTIRGGSLGRQHARKICKIMDMAAKIGCPIIGLVDSGGARIDEGIHALAGYGEIFMRNVRYSGVIPQITMILGPCAGGAAYSPALTDFIFTTRDISQLFITGPQVISEVLHQTVTKNELGGADVHTAISGVAHFVDDTEEESFSRLRSLLSYLPSNYLTRPHKLAPTDNTFVPASRDAISPHRSDDPSHIVPEDDQKAYDIKEVIASIVDKNTFFEVQQNFAANMVIGFARIGGNVVGIVANQSLVKAGTIDIDASCKAARFITLCDNFGIPVISLVDVPGFLPGIEQEHDGIIRHGAKLLYAYANATVPKITVILRKAYGGAYIVMGSKHLGADFCFAWPSAQCAVMGAKGAVQILNRREIAATAPDDQPNIRKKLEDDYAEAFLNPFTAAEHGYIDAIIEPSTTRAHLIRALTITHEKVEPLPRRKRGNTPL